ncbi:hypothetical protein BJI47_11170 [Rhodococcus sp. 1168]|nr:hypothetical protein BJI47_11170 [Rhodococcus sp. 1168]
MPDSPTVPGEQLPGPAPAPEQLPTPDSEIFVRSLPIVQVTDPAEIQRIGDSAIQESAQQQRSATPIQGCNNTRFKSCGVYIAPILQYRRGTDGVAVPFGTLNVNITLVMSSSVNNRQSNIFAYFESEIEWGTPITTGTFTFTPSKVGPDGIQAPIAEMRTFNLNPPGVISYEQYPEFSKLTTSSIGWSTYTFAWTSVIAGTIQEGPPPGTFYTEQRIRCDSTAAFGAAGCVNPTNYPTVYYNKAVIPTITQHVLDRQAITGEGRPFGSSLTRTNKDGIDLNRDISCPASQLRRLELLGEKPGPDEMENPSCDEYPLASSDQGGSGASVRWVPLKENNSQGGTMSQFYKGNRVMVGDNFYVNAFN